ncbi:M13 family metallopeptidase [bacterium]|nr:M13 family metallopeptidase [bacterium]
MMRRKTGMKAGAVLLAMMMMMAACRQAQHEAATLPAKPVDPANLDTTVAPGQDFFRYANGKWLDQNPVPAAYGSWTSFHELNLKNEQVLHEILAEAAKNTNAPRGSNLQKIGDFYATGMDSTKIEAQGLQPIAADLARLAALQSRQELERELAWFHLQAVPALFVFDSGDDDKNSTQVIAQIYQGGLGLPDRDYYFNQDERTRQIRAAYVQHVAAMLRLAGDDSATAAAGAQAVMAIETRLAKFSSTNVELRDSEKNYNKFSAEKLATLAPAFDWQSYFTELGIPEPGEINVGQPKFLSGAAALLDSVALSDWKTYLRWHLLAEAAPALSAAFVNENFEFYGTTLTGAKELRPRWRRVKEVIDNLMGEALGELYVARRFSPEAKTRAQAMVDTLLAAYGERLRKLDWMDDATRQAALKKLSTFGVKIGYPEVWRDYSALAIDRSSYFENLKRAVQFERRRQLGKIGKPIDRSEWEMSPPTVNAYYRPTRNEIVFPAGILQPPFFEASADAAVNYGGIGAVIGHEITHGFDDEGSKYDAEGNLRSWWSPAVRKQFEARAQRLVEHFNGYVAIDTLHVNGKLTLGENIADLGGLCIAYDGLQRALAGKPRPLIDGFTPEQRFFLNWAQVWRINYRPESLRLQVLTNVHAPGNFRVLGPLSNMPEFHAAFNVKPEQAMYLPAEKLARIW